jgi:hypothetical protein
MKTRGTEPPSADQLARWYVEALEDRIPREFHIEQARNPRDSDRTIRLSTSDHSDTPKNKYDLKISPTIHYIYSRDQRLTFEFSSNHADGNFMEDRIIIEDIPPGTHHQEWKGYIEDAADRFERAFYNGLTEGSKWIQDLPGYEDFEFLDERAM